MEGAFPFFLARILLHASFPVIPRKHIFPPSPLLSSPSLCSSELFSPIVSCPCLNLYCLPQCNTVLGFSLLSATEYPFWTVVANISTSVDRLFSSPANCRGSVFIGECIHTSCALGTGVLTPYILLPSEQAWYCHFMLFLFFGQYI